MVTRRRNPADNRSVFVRLTEEGRTQIVDHNREKIGFVNQMLDDFNEDELALLSDMLCRMQDNISEY